MASNLSDSLSVMTQPCAVKANESNDENALKLVVRSSEKMVQHILHVENTVGGESEKWASFLTSNASEIQDCTHLAKTIDECPIEEQNVKKSEWH
jgi:hypothetical protein